MNFKNQYSVIGLMSGTSLDGVDIAFCCFNEKGGQWKYEIIEAKTIKYSNKWTKKLKNTENQDAFGLVRTHVEYGSYLGEITEKFINTHKLKVDFISSHGHTVFHRPDKNLTFQIGDGAAIAAKCGLPVICDFRSSDVALGGQGAPLVPMGDKLLFAEYDYCLNLGGFANISYKKANKRIAFDICPLNLVLNHLSNSIGMAYDKKGRIARSGRANTQLQNKLSILPYYRKQPPKSLGKDWVEKNMYPLLNQFDIPIEDKLRTVIEHFAFEIYETVHCKPPRPHIRYVKEKHKILVSGGGAHNDFLIEQIKDLLVPEVIIPGKNLIDFKEALIFAFLGVLRMRNEINCLRSVTGASKDSIGGAIYWG